MILSNTRTTIFTTLAIVIASMFLIFAFWAPTKVQAGGNPADNPDTAQTVIDSKKLNIPQKGLTNDTVDNISKIVFGTLGAVALIIIIIAGIKFMTSQGNPEALAKARNTIIYAAVGLAVAIGAFSIVTFVVGRL